MHYISSFQTLSIANIHFSNLIYFHERFQYANAQHVTTKIVSGLPNENLPKLLIFSVYEVKLFIRGLTC